VSIDALRLALTDTAADANAIYWRVRDLNNNPSNDVGKGFVQVWWRLK
jgi:hypothetical protein